VVVADRAADPGRGLEAVLPDRVVEPLAGGAVVAWAAKVK
jgi:hypothetical protein